MSLEESCLQQRIDRKKEIEVEGAGGEGANDRVGRTGARMKDTLT